MQIMRFWATRLMSLGMGYWWSWIEVLVFYKWDDTKFMIWGMIVITQKKWSLILFLPLKVVFTSPLSESGQVMWHALANGTLANKANKDLKGICLFWLGSSILQFPKAFSSLPLEHSWALCFFFLMISSRQFSLSLLWLLKSTHSLPN